MSSLKKSSQYLMLLVSVSLTLFLTACNKESTESEKLDNKVEPAKVEKEVEETATPPATKTETTGAPSEMPPTSMPSKIKQPDGTVITLFLKGSACLHWEEDEQGYSVIKDDKRYVYAKKSDDGQLIATNYEVGKQDPSQLNIEKHLKPLPKKDCPFN